MSGGSWDYCYARIEEVSDRLCMEKDPLRRVLGQRLHLFARALHDIEWVDSGDMSEPDDQHAILEALRPFGSPAVASFTQVLKRCIEDTQSILKALE